MGDKLVILRLDRSKAEPRCQMARGFSKPQLLFFIRVARFQERRHIYDLFSRIGMDPVILVIWDLR